MGSHNAMYPQDGLPPDWAAVCTGHPANVLCGEDGSIEQIQLEDCWQIGLFHSIERPEKIIGRTFADLLPESDLARSLGTALAAGKPVSNFVAWFQNKDRTRRWVLFDIPEVDAASTSTTVVLRDVTEFMRSDIQHRCQTTRKERFFYNGIRNSVTIHDDTGTVLGMNRTSADALGYSVEEAQHIHLRDYVVGYTQEGLDQYWANVADGRTEYPSGMYKLQDGWIATSVRLRSVLLDYGARSFMRTTSVTLEDSTRHHETVSEGLGKVLQLTDKLIDSPDVDSLCLEAVRLGLTAIGLDRCSLYLVEEGKVHGTWGTDGTSEPTDEHGICFPLDNKWRRLARRKDLYLPNSDVEWDVPLSVSADGKLNTCGRGWLAWTPVMAGNRFLGVFFNDSANSHEEYDPAKQQVVEIFCMLLGSLIMMNRAEKARALAEEQFHGSERLQALGRLAGDIANDVNDLVAPVAPLSGQLLERLPQLKSTPTSHLDFFVDALSRIDRAASGAGDLVREAITLGREGEVPLEELNLGEVLTSYTDSPAFEKILATKPGIEFSVATPDTALLIKGSETHLRRALAQIATNAIEAIEDNGSLTIRAFAQGSAGNGVARIEIADTGCGIEAADLPRIFEPYFSTKTDTQSSAAGLSLAIAYDIVRRHDGEIEVQSTVNEGTRFVLSFPLVHKDL